jgi:hypothetical protein
MKAVARTFALSLLAAAAACARSAPEPEPLPPPAPAEAAPLPPPPPPPSSARTITVCEVRDGELVDVQRTYDPAVGDTTVDHAPRPPGYAAGQTWYVNNEPVTFRGRRLVKYGLPRILGRSDVRKVGEYQGVGVYMAADGPVDGSRGETIVYVPVHPGCEFQPYESNAHVGAVRGG